MSKVIPITGVGDLPMHGRIRTGVKTAKAMKAIDTFRFTSLDREALDNLAALYGGTVQPWYEPKANPPNQFELISEASSIDVVVQPGSIDIAYELWSGGGRERSCDGMQCEVPVGGDSGDYAMEPCYCFKSGVLECKIKTRVNVIIPGIRFAGVWRWDTHSENARHTLPSMMEIIDMLQAQGGLIPVEMALVHQEKMSRGQKRKFIIVQFRTRVTVDQMLSGQGTYAAMISSGTASPVAELAAPTAQAAREPHEPPPGLDDEIVEAELVDEVDDDMSYDFLDLEEAGYVPGAGGVIHDVPRYRRPIPNDPLTPVEIARKALHSNEEWPRKFKTRAEAMACARENPGKVIKKDGSAWEVR